MNSSQERKLALALVAVSLVLSAIGLMPELSAGPVYGNDNAAHLNLVRGMVWAIDHGANPLDFCSPEWSFGYPLVRSYQPLAHAAVVVVYFCLAKTIPLVSVFSAVNFLAILALPVGFFCALRLFEFDPLTAAAGAVLAPLISTKELYGLEYNSYVWIGHGLFPQALAAVLLLIALGLGFQAVRYGRRTTWAGVFLGLTALSQFMYGYLGALTVLLMVALPDSHAPRLARLQRAVWIGSISLLLSLFQLIPIILDRAILNHSSVEGPWRWDSVGAGTVLSFLFTGELLDHDRLPVLSLLALAGTCLVWWRHRKSFARGGPSVLILAGAVLWILLFFGRPTWGPLMSLLAPKDFHLHRLIGAAQIFLVLLAAIALGSLWRVLLGYWRGMAALGVSVLLLLPMVQERAAYLARNGVSIRENTAGFAAARTSLDSAVADVRSRGGRVYAGPYFGWGTSAMLTGHLPFLTLLNAARIPQISMAYHSLALTIDLMLHFDELKPEQYRLYNVQSVVEPASMASHSPTFLSKRAQFGQFAIYDAPGEGYFGLVDVSAAVPADRSSFLGINDRWLKSDWPQKDAYLWIDFYGNAPQMLPKLSPDAALPPVNYSSRAGDVRGESVRDETYEAEFTALRSSYLLFRMTWHPCWHAYLDGKPQATAMLSPGFMGVPVSAGPHRIVFRYEPGYWKLWLAAFGALAATILGAVYRRMNPIRSAVPPEDPPASHATPAAGKRRGR